ncbi:MAG: ABC transporter ATP-binding protein [Acidimicrobiia bacterium]|nr:ABC transporter ATP-binding protein [Acidimicrobiia bacterium]
MIPILDVRDLFKSYGQVVALDGVSLAVGEGEIVALLGPNGAGKTTLVSIVCGLRQADAGSVRVLDVDALAHPERARRHIGLAPQELGVYPVDTVSQNLMFFAEIAGLRQRDALRQVESIAEALRLSELMDRKAGQLSGGQKRRLHTAMALVNNPRLVLLDEATAGADVETRAALIEAVKDLAERGSSVLYSTHYLEEVEALGARVVIIDHGSVIAEGSVPDLIANSGSAVVELVFDGPPPKLGEQFTARYNGTAVRVAVDEPGRDAARILSSLGTDSERLVDLDFIRPSLESVFLSLTGRRYNPDEEVADVAAS